jgi:hypothetical protein
MTRSIAAAVLLIGFARLPADTFAPGPPSGRHLAPAPGLTLPFPSQPVQGFSSIAPVPKRDGWFYALADNGYGTKANSDDFLLRIYRVRPDFSTGTDRGRVEVDPAFVQLSDPERQMPYAIVNERTTERLLTGADFDPESLVVDRDGSFWIGEEFGPFILHVAADGRLIEAPIEADGLRSPDHPAAPRDARVARSRGFEGLAARRHGPVLLAMLEAGPEGTPAGTTQILEFDRDLHRFTGRFWTYRFDAAGHSATEIVPAAPSRGCNRGCESFFVIERDNEQGDAARFKKVFRIDLGQPGAEVPKTLAVDLLAIDNPDRIGAFGSPFRFPYITPEALWEIAPGTLIVANDNNYPETGGRAPGVRDDTEFIKLRLE